MRNDDHHRISCSLSWSSHHPDRVRGKTTWEIKENERSVRMREEKYTKNISRMLVYSSVSVQKWLELIERTCDLMVELEVVQVVKEERERWEYYYFAFEVEEICSLAFFFLLLVLDVQFS